MTGPKPLIAVVDDEAPIRRALTRLLRSAGMEVKAFPSGIEFLEAWTSLRPDCVVLDLHMPLVDGFEVQQRLAESPMRPPVVIITGHDSSETHARAMATKPVAYLRKPMNDESLLEAIALGLTSTRENQP